MAQTTLQYGVSVCCTDVGGGGTLSGKGFSDVRLFLVDQHSKHTASFRNCVFQVVPAQEHTAAQQVQKFRLENPGPETALDRSKQDRLRQLLDGVSMEARQNAERATSMMGQPVAYGAVVQLLHTNSNKFVTARPAALAETEKDCLLVELDSSGDDSSHFIIQPRFKHRSEGDVVSFADHIMLYSPAAHMYLHVTDTGVKHRIAEANLSSVSTMWQLRLYSPLPSSNPRVVRGGDTLRFVHWEVDASLVGDVELHTRQGRVALESVRQVRDEQDVPASTNGLWEIELQDSADGSDIQWGVPVRFRHVNSGLYLALAPTVRPMTGKVHQIATTAGLITIAEPIGEHEDDEDIENVIQAGLEEMLESPSKQDTARSGKARSGTPRAAESPASPHKGRDLSDVDSELVDEFLDESSSDELDSIASPRRTKPSFPEPARPGQGLLPSTLLRHYSGRATQRRPSVAIVHELCLMSQATAATLFSLHPTDPTNGPVARESSARIRHEASGNWLHSSKARRVTEAKSSGTDVLAEAKMNDVDGLTAPQVIRYQLLAVNAALELDSFLLQGADRREMEDTLFLLNALPCLSQFVRSVKRHANRKMAKFVALGHLIGRLRAKTRNSASTTESKGDAPPHHSDVVNSQHDKKAGMPASRGAMELVRRVLVDLNLFVTNRTGDPFDDNFAPDITRQRLLREHNAAGLLVSVLTVSFQPWGGPLQHDEAHPTLLLVCRLVYALLFNMVKSNPENEKHVFNHMDVFMAQCGVEFGAERMITQLLTDNLSLLEQMKAEHVQTFVSLIKTVGRRPMFVNFLAALCSCNGVGVTHMQELICDFIFGDRDGTYVAETDARVLGITDASVVSDVVLPVRAVGKQLQVCISTAGPGRWITLKALYANNHPLASYMTSCVTLYTEMCTGRNYQCMAEVEAMFPRDALFEFIRERQLEPMTRAAYIDLLVALHVDRRPHTVVAVADPTRLWSSLGKDDGTRGITTLEPQTRLWFQQVQHFVLSHLTELHGVMVSTNEKENILTRSVLRLCRQLLLFGLYGGHQAGTLFVATWCAPHVQHADGSANPQLASLCTALVLLLDGRNDAAAESDAVSKRGWIDSSFRGLDVTSATVQVPVSAAGYTAIPEVDGDNDDDTPLQITPNGHSRKEPPLRISTAFVEEVETNVVPPTPVSPIPLGGSRRTNQEPTEEALAFLNASTRWAEGTTMEVHLSVQGSSVLRDSSVADASLHTPAQSEFQARYVRDSLSPILMECKIIICDMLKHMVMLRLDFQLSKVLAIFYNAEKDAATLSSRQLEVNDLHAAMAAIRDVASNTTLSVQGMCPRLNVVATLLDLVMYNHSKLSTVAFDLLVMHFCSYAQLTSALGSVQLLVSSQTVSAYGRARTLLPKLQYWCETSEMWMGTESEKDQRTASLLRHYLAMFTALMWHTDADEELDETISSSKDHFPAAAGHRGGHVQFINIDSERQQLITNLGVPALVVTLMQHAYGMLINRKNAHRTRLEFLEALFELCAHCSWFLRTLLYNNPRAQEALQEHVPLFIHLVAESLISAELIGDIYMNNTNTIHAAKQSQLRLLVNHIERAEASSTLRSPNAHAGWTSSILAPFVCVTHAVKQDGSIVPVSTNQQMVLRLLSERHELVIPEMLLRGDAPTLVTVMNNPLDQDWVRDQFCRCLGGSFVKPLVATPVSAPTSPAIAHAVRSAPAVDRLDSMIDVSTMPSSSSDNVAIRSLQAETAPGYARYVYRMIQTLYGCVVGEYRDNDETEVKMQSMFTVANLVNLMRSPQLPIPAKGILLKLFNETWVNTWKSADRLWRHDAFLSFLSVEMKSMGQHFVRGGQDAPAAAHANNRSDWRLYHAEQVAYLFYCLVPTITMFVRKQCDTNVLPDHCISTLHTCVHQLVAICNDAKVRAGCTAAEIEGAMVAVKIIKELPCMVSLRRSSVASTSSPHAGSHSGRNSIVELGSSRPSTPSGAGVRTPTDIVRAYHQFLETLTSSDVLIEVAESEQSAFINAVRNVANLVNDLAGPDDALGPVAGGVPPLRPGHSAGPGMLLRAASKLTLAKHTIMPVKSTAWMQAFSASHVTFEQLMERIINLGHGLNIVADAELLAMILKLLHRLLNLQMTPSQQHVMQCGLTRIHVLEMVVGHLSTATRTPQLIPDLLQVGVDLLRGGNREVQSRFLQVLQSERTAIELLSNILKETCKEIHGADKNGTTSRAGVAPESLERVHLCLQLLQAMCEGHNREAQDFLRRPSSAHRTLNLVADTLALLHVLHDDDKLQSSVYAELASQTLDTLVEFVQGPCPDNQLELVSRKFVEVVGALLNAAGAVEGYNAKVLQLRCMVALTSLFEGRSDSEVHARVASLLPLPLLINAMTHVYKEFRERHDDVYSDDAFLTVFNKKLGETDVTAPTRKPASAATAVLETGFAIYMLFSKLIEDNAAFEARVRPGVHSPPLYAAAYEFFQRYTCRVEIVREGKLESFHFPEPPMCTHLTEQTKERVKWSVNRENATKKIQSFFGLAEEILEEMQHQQTLRHLLARFRILVWLYSRQELFHNISFTMAILINFLVLACYGAPQTHSSPERFDGIGVCNDRIFGFEWGFSVSKLLIILGAIQVGSSVTVLTFFVLNYGKLIARRGMRKHWMARRKPVRVGHHRHSAVAKATDEVSINDLVYLERTNWTVHHLSTTSRLKHWCNQTATTAMHWLRYCSHWFMDKHLMYFTAYVIMALLGTIVHPFFSAFCLADIVMRAEELVLVLRSVVRPRKALFLTALFFLVWEFWFSIIGFAYFRNDYVSCDMNNNCHYQCTSLFTCFMTTFDQGFKQDSGIGGYLQINIREPNSANTGSWALRILYDNMFKIIVIVILLNIVFGIIIDTFAELRDHKSLQEEDMQNVCYICNIERSEFDRRGNGFEHHIRHDHYSWNYLKLTAYLLLKPSTELTGVEDYLLRLVKAEAWTALLPLHKAMVLSREADTDHGREAATISAMQGTIEELERRLRVLESDASGGNRTPIMPQVQLH